MTLESIIKPKDYQYTDKRIGSACTRGWDKLDTETKQRLTDANNQVVKHRGEVYKDVLCLIENIHAEAIKLDIGYSKDLRQQTRLIVNEFGFSASQSSRLVTVAVFSNDFTEADQSKEWFKSQSFSVQSALATAGENAYRRAWTELSEWGKKSVTEAGVRKLADRHTTPVPKSNFKPSYSSGSVSYRASEDSPTPTPSPSVEDEPSKEVDNRISLLNQDAPGEQANTEPKTPTPSDSYQLYKAIESYVQTNYRTWSEEDEHNMRMSVELIARYSRGQIRPN